MEKWRMYITLALVLMSGVILAMYVVDTISDSLAKRKKAPLSNREKMAFWVAVLIFSGVHCLFSNTILAIILAVILLIGCYIAANAEKKARAARVMFLAGLPAVVAIIVNVIFNSIANFNKGKSLYFLLAPAAFSLFLWLYRQIGMEKRPRERKAKRSKKKIKLSTVLTWAAVIAILAVGTFIGAKYVKGTNEAKQETAEAAQAVKDLKAKASESKSEVKAEPLSTEPKEKVSFTASLVKTEPSEEEKAIKEEYGEDAYLVAGEKTDEEVSADVEYGKQRLSQEIFDQYESKIPEEFCWNSLSITRDGEPSHVTSSAKDHGYVNYNISSALSTAFSSAKDDNEGLGEELMTEHANPYFTSVLARGLISLRYVGDVRLGDMYDFLGRFIAEDRKAFAKDEEEFWKLMDEDKVLWKDYTPDINFDGTPGLTYLEIPGEGGDGIDHWVLPAYDGESFKLTHEYRIYVAKIAALMWTGDLISYEGVKDRTTVIKSVVDNRVAFGFGPEQEQAGFMRGQFTDLPSRQVKAPALLFAVRDKNGKISGDMFGIDYWDKNFEIFGGEAKDSGGKKIIIQDNPVKKPANSGTAKLGNTSNPSSPDNPSNPPDKPDKPKKKKATKDPTKDPSNKSQNAAIKGKITGTDVFQPVGTQPTNWGTTVGDAQYQPTPETQEIIENGKAPGTGVENPEAPSGEGTRTTESGAVVKDSERPTEDNNNNQWTEQEEAQTTEIPVKPDPDDDGDQDDNTGMPAKPE